MATSKIGENFRSYLAASTDINAIVGGSSSVNNARIFNNEEPNQTAANWIWFIRSREEQEQLLDGTYSQIIETEFDIEAVVKGKQATADDLADKIKARLKTASVGTTMGNDATRACTFEDHDEDYIPRTGRNEGYSIAAIRAVVYHTT